MGDLNNIPGYLCFSFEESTPKAPQRACYSDARARQVKEIREIGACLRCQLLKKSVRYSSPERRAVSLTTRILQCSKGNPCERCIKAAATSHTSRCLAWMQCIRPSLAGLNIFKFGKVSLNGDRDDEADININRCVCVPTTIYTR